MTLPKFKEPLERICVSDQEFLLMDKDGIREDVSDEQINERNIAV
jgi:hypothetical protein